MEDRKFTGKVLCRPVSSEGLDWQWITFTVFAKTQAEAEDLLQFRLPYESGYEHVRGLKEVQEVLPQAA